MIHNAASLVSQGTGTTRAKRLSAEFTAYLEPGRSD